MNAGIALARVVWQQRLARLVVVTCGILLAFAAAVRLGPLPAWVRGLARVRTWVWAKLLINGVRIVRKHDLRRR